jgi:Ca-activated chloride channel family protein
MAAVAAHVLGGRRPDDAIPWRRPRWLDDLPTSARQCRRRLARALAVDRGSRSALCGPRALRGARGERRGVDVALLLDASSSMTVAVRLRDDPFLAPRANAVRDFAAARGDDRVGLTLFARWPRLSCPLTADHALFEARLAAADPVDSGGDEDRTAIGVALAAGAQQLGPKGARERVLVLVTDGANNLGPITPEDGTRLCRDAGIRVYTIALGGGERFGSGSAPVDTKLLAAIAAATGGRTFAAEDGAGCRRDADHRRAERAPCRSRWKREGVARAAVRRVALLLGCALVPIERTWGGWCRDLRRAARVRSLAIAAVALARRVPDARCSGRDRTAARRRRTRPLELAARLRSGRRCSSRRWRCRAATRGRRGGRRAVVDVSRSMLAEDADGSRRTRPARGRCGAAALAGGASASSFAGSSEGSRRRRPTFALRALLDEIDPRRTLEPGSEAALAGGALQRRPTAATCCSSPTANGTTRRAESDARRGGRARTCRDPRRALGGAAPVALIVRESDGRRAVVDGEGGRRRAPTGRAWRRSPNRRAGASSSPATTAGPSRS